MATSRETGRQALMCGMHVHVDVEDEDEDEAVAVADGLRPWLPLLLAISANSPVWRGVDTGYASFRSQIWGRFPSAGPAQPYQDPQTLVRPTPCSLRAARSDRRAEGGPLARRAVGIADRLLDPFSRRLVPARSALDDLVQYARPALEASADLAYVMRRVTLLLAHGSGAVRQRAVHEATGDLRAVVRDVAGRTPRSPAGAA